MQPIDWNNHDESIRTVRQAYFFVSNEQKKRKSSPLARLSISASRSSSNRSRVAKHSPQISTPITCSCRSTTASNCSSSGRLREPWSRRRRVQHILVNGDIDRFTNMLGSKSLPTGLLIEGRFTVETDTAAIFLRHFLHQTV